jgi:CRISPR-associated protein Cmr3
MRFQLSPIDTWFFRDGTPFDKDGASQAGVVGVFPPYPPTVAGAIRAALARRNGWDGRSVWRGDLAAVLGDGPSDLGRLRITGPFVLRGGTPVFPLPRHVVGGRREGAWEPVALLRPGPAVACDLGPHTRLPEVPGDAGTRAATTALNTLETGSDQWVTLAGLDQILRGDLPAGGELILSRELWVGEGRVGIERGAATRTVIDSALYSTRHVRLSAGVSLGVEVDGVPSSWASVDGLISLGGESRLAACEVWPAGRAMAFDGPAPGMRSAILVALTPVLLDAAARPATDFVVPGARIVSACLDRPLRIGGWDGRTRTAERLRNAAAPGSVWFCELDDVDAFRRSIDRGLTRVGAGIAMGFGLCAVGGAPHWETAR